MSRLRIAIIGSSRFAIAEPFAGGLEAHVWALADGLLRRGHAITLFAGPGSDPALPAEVFDLQAPCISDAARADVSMPAPQWLDEHHAYLKVMLRLGRRGDADFDIVHNHSLHYLPIAMASALRVPLLSTLHTPPTPWLESAIQASDDAEVTFVAVSAHTAHAWSHLLHGVHVVHNGVDLRRWTPGPGGDSLVWSGRIAPEKGTHLAIDAAVMAGVPLRVAGPITDPAYFETEIRARLALPRIEYLGHLTHNELRNVVGTSAGALVTPCWDEPYGLVVAEALALGTPVLGFARGALPELLDPACGQLVAPGNTIGLARAISTLPSLSRKAARRRAVEHCSIDAMIGHYERLYQQLVPGCAR
jgi:glycosyltransferase involved in cell wall biosynthesis